jgi:DNA-binding NtrC family response regulator
MPPEILLVEDHDGTRSHLTRALEGAGYRVTAVADGSAALLAMQERTIDLVLSDFRMEPMDGITLLREVQRGSDVPVLIYSAGADREAVFRAGREGAVRFLDYPFRVDEQLLPTVAAALRPPPAADSHVGVARLVGTSPGLRRLRAAIRRLAPAPTSVLIQGETGTGKELVARSLHEERGRGEFVTVAIPELADGLLESELFGHERGAFTGAVASHSGLFARADGGTLFLDEIGDAPMAAQVKLLRALETRTVRPVGGAAVRPVDVRVVAATNRDLSDDVATGRFRQDLFYRIRGALLQVPPLRDRTVDVAPIVRAILPQLAAAARLPVPELDAGFLRALSVHPWPGNVRELRATLEHVILWWDGEAPLARSHAVEAFVALNPGVGPEEREVALGILEAWRRSGGNQEAARRELGMTRAEWRTRFSRLGVPSSRRRP